MNEITQPSSIALVKPRDEGRSQGQGKPRDDGPPPKKVAEAYKETSKTKPVDDRITILGIPAEQITPATQAALASLVAEVNFLRAAVRRLEPAAKREGANQDAEIIPQDALVAQLSRLLGEPLLSGVARVLVLAYLGTFEDVRRSSGLLAANTLLADLAQRMARAEFTPAPDAVTDITQPAAHGPGQFRFRAVGFAGGSTLVGLAELPAAGLDETHVAKQVREQCLEAGFNVAGIDMAVALSVAAVVLSPSEGALTAMGRADHLLRGGSL